MGTVCFHPALLPLCIHYFLIILDFWATGRPLGVKGGSPCQDRLPLDCLTQRQTQVDLVRMPTSHAVKEALAGSFSSLCLWQADSTGDLTLIQPRPLCILAESAPFISTRSSASSALSYGPAEAFPVPGGLEQPGSVG